MNFTETDHKKLDAHKRAFLLYSDSEMSKNNTLFSYGQITLLSIFCLIGILAYKYWDITIYGQRLFTLSMVSVMCGLLYESFRITEKWIYVPYIFIGAIFFSCVIFLPGKHDRYYDFYDKILRFPYFFTAVFTLLSVCVYQEKIITKLTEGATLLQSLAVIYWLIEYGTFNNNNLIIKALWTICIAFSAFSIYNALTYTPLSNTKRLWLSIWSCTIMLLFSIDNIVRVFQNPAIEATFYISDKAYIALQYFLLGVSAMYIAQNSIMLLGFLPGKGSFFNSAYFSDLRELKSTHLGRYSEDQVYIGHSIICIILTSLFFGFNHVYNFLPVYMAIMVGFVLFPTLLNIARLVRHFKLQRRAYK